MLKWIREDSSARVYNQMRVAAIVLGPALIVFGIAGLLGLYTFIFQGTILSGIARIIISIVYIVIGILISHMRLTVFQKKRKPKA